MIIDDDSLDLKDFKDMERESIAQHHQAKLMQAVSRQMLIFAQQNILRLGGETIDQEQAQDAPGKKDPTDSS